MRRRDRPVHLPGRQPLGGLDDDRATARSDARLGSPIRDPATVSRLVRTTVEALHRLRRWLLARSWFTSTVLPAIPRPVRWALRRLYFLPSDVVDRMDTAPAGPVPPRSAIFTGSVDDFERSGEALVRRLIDLAGLTPGCRVLDVGSGMGRLAVALLPYLDETGGYEGLDIVPAGIRWCEANIAPRRPGFRFTLADIRNAEYNPRGQVEASAYRFPYDDRSFDLVVLASVFTHLLPADTERYVAEIARVLRPGGRCYASFSLIDERSLKAMEDGRSTLRFRHRRGDHWILDPKVPELAVAYEATYVRDLYARSGLTDGYLVHHGSWVDRPTGDAHPSFSQDIVVAARS